VTVRNSLIADGCQIDEGSVIEDSVIGVRCRIGRNVRVRRSIVMGADYYEPQLTSGQIPLGIGDDSEIDGAIVDKLARLGRSVRIANPDGYQSRDEHGGCLVRDQIPIVLKNTTLPDGWHI
jgi:glucose-1-phosphate adenylyltransferase